MKMLTLVSLNTKENFIQAARTICNSSQLGRWTKLIVRDRSDEI